MDVNPNILVVEDDPAINKLICKTLKLEGWGVISVSNGKRALIEAAAKRPECILLDLGLPDMDGIGVLQSLRAWSDVPIIVLTARDQENSKVTALDAGANDYVTKPFGIAELLARLRVQLRLRQPKQHESVYEFGAVNINSITNKVTFNKEEVHLTPTEYRLLLELIRHEGKICSQRQLLLAVWGPNYVESPQYLRIYMGKLRQKLEATPENPKHFLTEIGFGYRFVSNGSETPTAFATSTTK